MEATGARLTDVHRVVQNGSVEYVFHVHTASQSGWVKLEALRSLVEPVEDELLRKAFFDTHARKKISESLHQSSQTTSFPSLFDAALSTSEGNAPKEKSNPLSRDTKTSKNALEKFIKRARARTFLELRSSLIPRIRSKVVSVFLLALVVGIFKAALKWMRQQKQQQEQQLQALNVLKRLSPFKFLSNDANLLSVLVGALFGGMSSVLLYETEMGKFMQLDGVTEVGTEKKDVEMIRKAFEGDLRERIEKEVKRKYGVEDQGEENQEEEDERLAGLAKEIDLLEERRDFQKALEVCRPFLDRPDASFELTWRMAKVCYAVADIRRRESGSLTDPTRLELLENALAMTEYMLENHSDKSISHKYYAICVQEYSNHQGTKEKIIAGKAFFDHTKEAIQLDPNDATLHYMLGRFNYEVAKLSWAERLAAKAIFGQEPPKTTYEEALDCFLRAKQLREPQTPELRDDLEIARTYITLRQYEQARAHLDVVINAKEDPANPDVEDAREEAKQLAKSL